MALIDGTKAKLEEMITILKDETSNKGDVLTTLADAKIIMFKEEEEARKEKVALETELEYVKNNYEKTRRDNIDLVDRIKAQQDSFGVTPTEKEELKEQEEKKKAEEYAKLERQFGREYANQIMTEPGKN